MSKRVLALSTLAFVLTGAGSLISANHLYRVAKPDGLTIGHFNGALFLGQALGQPGIEFDARKFELIGAPIKEDSVCALTRASGVTSVEKWMASKTPVKLGGVAPGGTPDANARILKAAPRAPDPARLRLQGNGRDPAGRLVRRGQRSVLVVGIDAIDLAQRARLG